MKTVNCLQLLLTGFATHLAFAQTITTTTNSTYYNPILPGWHSDPSCTQVNQTFYCVTSTFIAFPGLPIYASDDLTSWKLASHVWNRESQLPGASHNSTGQQVGMYAATLRHHAGVFHVVCTWLGLPSGNLGVIFTTTDPFADSAWSDPVTFETTQIDPDLFWDDDGTVYLTQQGIVQQTINLTTGALDPPTPESLWNGTGGVWPEGPHIYKKDGWYYLLIAEGGTETNHSVVIARSTSVTGPYEGYEAGNPILTARGTDAYFQTVGHADLFQDAATGNWWGVALATRSGPAWDVYPMGREAVLYPVTWDEGEWPVLQHVEGVMSGWLLPAVSRDLPGDGPWVSDPDVYDFASGSSIPPNLVHWRVPPEGAFSVTDQGLQIVPSRGNLTGAPDEDGLSFIGRRQTDSLFSFSADFDFTPQTVGQEAGVTVFLTQLNHIDLSVVLLESATGDPQLTLRFQAEAPWMDNPVIPGDPPAPVLVPVLSTWPENEAIRLQIQTANATHYRFSAMPVNNPNVQIILGTASAQLVSGGNGTFVGSLVGAYATCNGAGGGLACPEGGNVYVNRWRYTGVAQYISATELVVETTSS